MLAHVEYLTYEIRKRRRVFRLPRRSIPIRIVIAFFAGLGYALHKPNPWEKSKKGVATPFLVVLQGIAKGENRNSPFGVSFLPPAAFSLPRKEKGAESFPASFGRGFAHSVREKASRILRMRFPAPLARIRCHPSGVTKPRALAGAKEVSPLRGDETASFGRGYFCPPGLRCAAR